MAFACLAGMSKPSPGVTLAGNIRRQRKRAGLSISEAARRAGISQGEWSRYESAVRQPRITRLVWMADAIGTVAANLVLGIDVEVLESRHSAAAKCPP